MAHKTLIGGTAYEIKGGNCLVDGTGYAIQKGRTLVDGTGYDISFASGVALADIAEGEVVYLNENGSPVEFYVACHNYESSLNGMGRTLLVRKDCYDKRKWHSSSVNTYAVSDIDAWLNGDYKALLDEAIQSAMGATTFYYTIGGGDATKTTLTRSAFLLSTWECELGAAYGNTEGSVLPIASVLQIAYYEGSALHQWTRTVNKTVATGSVYAIKAAGTADYYSCTSSLGSRPCFTLPSTSLFEESTMEFDSCEITFVIGSTTYSVQAGTTWRECPYVTCDESTGIVRGHGLILLNPDWTQAKPGDLIYHGYSYIPD